MRPIATGSLPLTAFLLSLFVSLVSAPAALAQTPDELKAENARLQERVRELEIELEKAQRNVRVLSEEIKRLRSARPTGRTPAKSTPEKTPPKTPATEVPLADDRFASPRAYITKLRESYEERFKEAGEIDPNDGAAKSLRIVDVRSWAGNLRRELRGPIDWLVKLDPETPLTGREATFLFVHEPTGQTLGDGFPVRMGRADLRRLNDADAATVYRLRGLVNGRVNPSYERGAETDEGEGFFVGAYAELTMDIKVDSLRPQ